MTGASACSAALGKASADDVPKVANKMLNPMDGAMTDRMDFGFMSVFSDGFL